MVTTVRQVNARIRYQKNKTRQNRKTRNGLIKKQKEHNKKQNIQFSKSEKHKKDKTRRNRKPKAEQEKKN